MCNEALEVDPWSLYYIPDYLKTQKICNETVEADPSSLQFVPDWFVTQQQLNVWFDDDYWYHNDDIIEWYDGYKKKERLKKQRLRKNSCLLLGFLIV